MEILKITTLTVSKQHLFFSRNVVQCFFCLLNRKSFSFTSNLRIYDLGTKMKLSIYDGRASAVWWYHSDGIIAFKQACVTGFCSKKIWAW